MSGTLIPRFLRQLRDVQLTTPADNEVLTYEASSSKFKNKSPASVSSTLGAFNVLDYGAVGDGVTDDTLAIQAALDAASTAATAAGGGVRATVLIPGPNTYKLTYSQDMTYNQRLPGLTYSAALIMLPNINLRGVGRPCLFADAHGQHLAGQIARVIIGVYENGLASDGVTQSRRTDNCSISGFVVDGGFRADETSPGVAFPDATEDFFGIGLLGDDMEIYDNHLIGIWGDSVSLGYGGGGSPPAYRSRRVRVHHNYFTLMNGQAINPTYPDQLVVSDNVVYDSQAVAGGASESIPLNAVVGPCLIVNNVVEKAGAIETASTPGALGWTVIANNIVRPLPGTGDGLSIRQGVAIGNIIDLEMYNCGNASAVRGIGIEADGQAVGNTVICNPNAPAAHPHVGIQATAGSCLVASNVVRCSTPSVYITDISCIAAGSVVKDNHCSAGVNTSINSLGAGNLIDGNHCAAAVGIQASADVRNNTMVAPSGLAPALTVLTDGGIIENNRIDISASTGRGIWIRFPGKNNIIRNNKIISASGVGVLVVDGGLDGGDVWENNTITGGGTLTLASNQSFRRPQGGINTLTYGTTVATDATLGDYFKLVVTDNVAFTITNPTGLQRSMRVTYDIKNSIGGGGTVGTITWGSAGLFLLAGAFTNPADTKRRTITFVYDGTNLVETNRAGADI